ncbi:MAG: hypothetical protein M0C28_47775 [Candidatus Moduliflexus flocculans]|nr:hypothetical protein [Candidatus Moduliflexus flocculans]
MRTIRLLELGSVPAVRSQTCYHAAAYSLAEGTPDTVILVSPSEPYVCVGYHQEVDREVDRAYCRERGLPVFRREVGAAPSTSTATRSSSSGSSTRPRFRTRSTRASVSTSNPSFAPIARSASKPSIAPSTTSTYGERRSAARARPGSAGPKWSSGASCSTSTGKPWPASSESRRKR